MAAEFRVAGYSDRELWDHFIFKYDFSDRERLLAPRKGATTSGVLALKLKFDNRTQELGMPQMLQDLHSSVLQHPEGSTAFGTDRWLVANLGSPSLRSLAGRAPK